MVLMGRLLPLQDIIARAPDDLHLMMQGDGQEAHKVHCQQHRRTNNPECPREAMQCMRLGGTFLPRAGFAMALPCKHE